MGAMENKGLNIFNDKYVLVDPDTGTDQDYAHVEAVIAHEYFITGRATDHLPRLVPALPEEGLTFSATRNFRPTCARARSNASRTSWASAAPVPRRCRDPWRTRSGPAPTADQQLSTPRLVREGRGNLPDAADRAGAARASAPAWIFTSSGTTAMRRRSRIFLACFSHATGRDLSQFALWYHQPAPQRLPSSTGSSLRQSGSL
jgi:aminopeptidase N